MKRTGVALAIVAATIGACGAPPPSPSRTAAPPPSPSRSTAPPSAGSPGLEGVTPVPSDALGLPAIVANRTELPSCGIERATGQLGPWNVAARTCFWTAHESGQPAEFTSTRLTIEGDPITTIHRVLGDGSVELFIDSTQDRFGSGTWEHATCTALVPIVGGLVEPDFGADETCEFTAIE